MPSFWLEGDESIASNPTTTTPASQNPPTDSQFDEGFELGARLASIIQDPTVVLSDDELHKIRTALIEAGVDISPTASAPELLEAICSMVAQNETQDAAPLWKNISTHLTAWLSTAKLSNKERESRTKQLNLINKIAAIVESNPESSEIPVLIEELTEFGELPEEVVEVMTNKSN
ncbi:hypothetical protein RCL1_000201 [Eukaryota sp. TZLM3-RCL]